MYCKSCAEPLPEDATFCGNCGAAVAPTAEAMTDETFDKTMDHGIIFHETASEPVADPVASEELPEAVSAAPVSVQQTTQPKKKKRNKPHILVRILLQFFSFALAVVLMATVLAGVLLLDLKTMTSSGGIKQIIDAILMPKSAPTYVESTPRYSDRFGGVSLSRMVVLRMDEADVTDPSEYTIPDGSLDLGGVDLSDLDLGNIPEDILTGGGGAENVSVLVDWLYEQIDATTDTELSFSKEAVQSFVENSTVSEYLSEKLSEYAEDFINGTENAFITTEELVQLLEENEELLRTELNIELTPETKQKFTEVFDHLVVEQDINSTIRDTVYEAVDSVLQESAQSMGGLDLISIQATLKTLTSSQLRNIVIGAAVVLMVLLCLLNYYNLPAGLTWSGIPCLLMGLILSLPILLVEKIMGLLSDMLPELASVWQIAPSMLALFKPYHYGLLILGIALLAISIVWRIIRASLRKKP